MMANDMSRGIELGRILAGKPHDPVVYFARLGGGLVKIGTTTRLRNRMASLYLDLTDVLLIVPGGVKVERAFHDRFRECRVDDQFRNELFEIKGQLRLFLLAAAYRAGDDAHWAETLGVAPSDPVGVLEVHDRVCAIVADRDADLEELDYLAKRAAALDPELVKDSVHHWDMTAKQARGEAWRDWRDRDLARLARQRANRAKAARDSFLRVLGAM